MHQSELEPFHNPKSVSDQTGLSSDLRNSIQTSVEITRKHSIAWDLFIYIVKVAGWRDGHKRTRSSDSSWQSESSLVVLRTKRNLLEVAVFWNEAGAVNPQQGGVLRHSAMQKSKSRTSSKKLCELFVGGAHFLQHHSHPAPLHPAPGRHHAACPGCYVDTGRASDFVIAREQSSLFWKWQKIGKSCVWVRPSRLCSISLYNPWSRQAEGTKFSVERRCAFVLKETLPVPHRVPGGDLLNVN